MPSVFSGPPLIRRGAGRLAVLLAVTAWLGAEEGPTVAPRPKLEPPVPTHQVSPVHPQDLKKDLINGQAILETVVEKDGSVGEIKVVSATQPEFGEAAVEAMRQWAFSPGTADGKPVALRIRVPFEFKLSPDQILGIIARRPVFEDVTETVIPASQLPAWPRPLQFFTPRYPPELKGSGKYGKAVVDLTIDKEGKVINPRIVKATYPEFIVPALITATQLRFPPQVMADGKVIYVSLTVQFDFKVPVADKGTLRKKK